jgi:hypothetical protein
MISLEEAPMVAAASGPDLIAAGPSTARLGGI